MLYVFKPFWSLLTKGGEAYELIVFKWFLMGGCITFAKSYNSRFLIHLVLWVVTLKLDGRLLLYLLLCGAMINPAWSHTADVHLSLCIPLSLLLLICIMHCLHTLMMASTKQNLPCAFAFKYKSFICTSSGGASSYVWRQYSQHSTLTYIYPRWKLQAVCHQSPRRGRL